MTCGEMKCHEMMSYFFLKFFFSIFFQNFFFNFFQFFDFFDFLIINMAIYEHNICTENKAEKGKSNQAFCTSKHTNFHDMSLECPNIE